MHSQGFRAYEEAFVVELHFRNSFMTAVMNSQDQTAVTVLPAAVVVAFTFFSAGCASFEVLFVVLVREFFGAFWRGYRLLGSIFSALKTQLGDHGGWETIP